MSHVSHTCAFARLCVCPLFISAPQRLIEKKKKNCADKCCPLAFLPSFFSSIFTHFSLSIFYSLFLSLSLPASLVHRVRQPCSLYFSLRPHQFQPIYIPVSLHPSPRSSLSFPLKSVTYLQHSCLMNNGGETVTISVSIRRICFDLGCARQPRFAFPQRLPAQLYSQLLSFCATMRAGGKQCVQLYFQGSAAMCPIYKSVGPSYDQCHIQDDSVISLGKPNGHTCY